MVSWVKSESSPGIQALCRVCQARASAPAGHYLSAGCVSHGLAPLLFNTFEAEAVSFLCCWIYGCGYTRVFPSRVLLIMHGRYISQLNLLKNIFCYMKNVT